MSRELIKKADEIISKTRMPDRHSFFQLEKFLIGKECTCQAQLWQITREISTRREAIESLDTQIDETQDSLELIDISIERLKTINESLKDELDIRESKINMRKAQRNQDLLIKSIEKTKEKIKYTLEEINFLVQAHEDLSKIEEMKSFDDVEAQKEYWNQKLLEEFNLSVLLSNPLNPDLVKTILALDDASPVKHHVVNILEQTRKSMIEKKKSLIGKNKEKLPVKNTESNFEPTV